MSWFKLAVSRVTVWWLVEGSAAIVNLIRSLQGIRRARAVSRLLAAVASAAVVWLLHPAAAFAAPLMQSDGSTQGLVALAAALSTGLAALAAGIAVGSVGSAAVGAVSEDRENLGLVLIFVGLAEGVAIYGLIISFLILNR